MTQKPHHNACCMLTDIRKTKNHYSPLLVGLSIIFSLLCSNRKNSSGRRSPMPEESKVGYCNVGFCFVCKNRRRRRKGTKSVCLSLSLSHAPVAGVEATDPVVLVACQASLEIRTNAAHRHDSLPHDAQPKQSNHNYTTKRWWWCLQRQCRPHQSSSNEKEEEATAAVQSHALPVPLPLPLPSSCIVCPQYPARSAKKIRFHPLVLPPQLAHDRRRHPNSSSSSFFQAFNPHYPKSATTS